MFLRQKRPPQKNHCYWVSRNVTEFRSGTGELDALILRAMRGSSYFDGGEAERSRIGKPLHRLEPRTRSALVRGVDPPEGGEP